jgi:hypothetical protein
LLDPLQGKPVEAAPHFAAATKFDFLLSPEPYFNLAFALEQLPGQAGKARAVLREAKRLQAGTAPDESALFPRVHPQKPESWGRSRELRLMWPYGYPVPGSRQGY